MQNKLPDRSVWLSRLAACALVSVAVVCMCVSHSLTAHAATVRLLPSDIVVKAGEVLSVRVSLTSEDQAVNAVSGVINFPSNLLELTSLSKGASIVGLWVQEPSFSNAQGTVRFEGVVLNPGFIGSGGTVITARFRALKSGNASLTLSEVQALANDGRGTDILSESSGAILAVGPASAKLAQKEVIEPVVPHTELPSSEVAFEEPIFLPQPRQYTDWREIARQWAATIGIGFGVTALILFVGAVCALGLLRYRSLKHRMRNDLRTVDATMHKALVLLRDEIEEFVEALEKEKSKRKLTLLESRFAKRMKQDLVDTEKVMKKDIHDAADKL